MEHRVELPTGLRVHSFKYLFEHVPFFPSERPDSVTLSFHPKFTRFEPFSVAMLAAWGRYWGALGIPVRCVNANANGVAYAQRLGLFNFVPADGLRELQEHEETGRFIALREIKKHSDIGSLVADLGAILRDETLIRLGQHALSEITRNVVEHAESDGGLVCAQYYRKDKRISIGVADCGRGVKNALAAMHGFKTDGEAIVGALKPGISGTVRRPYSAADNAGLGLFIARGLAKASRQYFMIVSGSAAYRLAKTPHNQADVDPKRNPVLEKHLLCPSIRPWKGTVVAIDLRGVDRKFDAVMSSIRDVIGDDPTDRRVRAKIRFSE